MFSAGGYGIAWNGTLWVAVGEAGANTIATSPDGVNWTGRGSNVFPARGVAVASRRVLPFVGTRTTGGILFDTSGAQLANGIFRNQPGTVSAPSYTFVNDLSMGLYDPSTNILGFVTAGIERMQIDASGNIGINAPPTLARFHVNGSSPSIQGSGSFWYNSTTLSNMTAGDTRNVSIYGSSFIWSGTGYLNTSDQRIKRNIQDIQDTSALETLRLVQPKTYGYIETLTRGSGNVSGFLAQQVESVLPDGVKTCTEYIPNMYDRCVAEGDSNGLTRMTLETKTVDILPQTDPSGNERPIRIKLFTKADREVIATLDSVVSSNVFTVKEPLPDTEYFAYGQEVNDFKILNKDVIFTVATAALQEVDRQLQVEKAKTAELQTHMSNALARIAALESA
jgi:hypothetical protein